MAHRVSPVAGPVRFCVIGRGVGKARVDSTCLASGKILIIAQPSPTDDEVRARRRKSVLDGGFQFEVPTEEGCDASGSAEDRSEAAATRWTNAHRSPP